MAAAKKEVRKSDKKINNTKNIAIIILLIGILGAATFYFSASSKNIHLSGKLWFGKVYPMITDNSEKVWSVTENADAGITGELLQSYMDKNVEIDGRIITVMIGGTDSNCMMSQVGCKHDVEVVLPEKIRVS